MDGYLPYYDEVAATNDPDEYEEQTIVRSNANVHLEEASAVADATILTEITEADIRTMTKNKLKEVSRKRGKAVGENKDFLVGRFLDAIRMNVPVSAVILQREECMNGLDMTLEWVQLTPTLEPVPEPENKGSKIRPPREKYEQNINIKYGFHDEFQRFSFEVAKESMQYKRHCQAKMSPMRKRRGETPVEPHVKGGLNEKFLENYGIDQNSHQADWFSVFMTLTDDENLEELSDIDAIGNGKMKLAVSNFTCYINTKAMIVNTRE